MTEVGGVAVAPPPLMQPVRARLFGRRKLADGGKPPKPPGPKSGLTPPGKPNVPCDKCHVATATHEVEVDKSLRLYLFFCGHHIRERWTEFRSRGYDIRKL